MFEFRDKFGYDMFHQKYAMAPGELWSERVDHIVDDVCKGLLDPDEVDQLKENMRTFKWMPGGRYIYYGGRGAKFWNNCFTLKGEEDTREEWGNVYRRASSCLMTGGGIGVDYSVFRPEGAPLGRTGGIASGPIPLMRGVDNIGQNAMQGGSRRSAIFGSLNWQHADIASFLKAKDYKNIMVTKKLSMWDLKQQNMNFTLPLEMTNISANYDDHFLSHVNRGQLPEMYIENVYQGLMTGDPGFSFNFGPHTNETLRNACTEVTSEDDSDVCNLGSVNMARCGSLDEFKEVVELGAKFLICGSIRSELPYQKVYDVREANRRIGVGLMGIHEWLVKHGSRYEMTPELSRWLSVYRDSSVSAANEICNDLSISQPEGYRAIAPTGSIAILAGTTPGIEPLYASAYRRRVMKNKKWHYTVKVDSVARMLVEEYGLDPDKLETSADLGTDPERRIKFQADVQDYVDMGISSTINLPAWGTEYNNEDTVRPFAELLARYASRLRGFTMYPDGAYGNQPLTPVPYAEALASDGHIVEEANDVCDITKAGSCGG